MLTSFQNDTVSGSIHMDGIAFVDVLRHIRELQSSQQLLQSSQQLLQAELAEVRAENAAFRAQLAALNSSAPG